MMPPEFSRRVSLDALGQSPHRIEIEADEAERTLLAARFGLVGIARLEAEVELVREGEEVTAAGRIAAQVTQACVVTGAPVVVQLNESFAVRFRPIPSSGRPDEEIELGESELDVSFYENGAIDLGEAAAQTLALALDPYPRSPEAEATLKAAGVKSEEEAGPFGALAALKGKLKK